MKIDRARLLANVERAIADQAQRHQDEVAEKIAQYDQALADWRATEHPKLLAAQLRELANKAARGIAVTTQDLGALDYDRTTHGFRWSGSRPVMKPLVISPRLQGLRDTLLLTDDDIIASSTLADLGYRNISDLLR